MKVLIAILMLLLTTGCANQELLDWADTLPQPHADYGEYPEQYQDTVMQYFSDNLRDFDSALFTDLTIPRKEHVIITVNKHPAVVYGYSVCIYVNAKNAFGGYTGKQLYYFIVREDTVISGGSVKQGGNFLGFGRIGKC